MEAREMPTTEAREVAPAAARESAAEWAAHASAITERINDLFWKPEHTDLCRSFGTGGVNISIQVGKSRYSVCDLGGSWGAFGMLNALPMLG